MMTDKKILYNGFQLAQMKQSKGDNKLAFLKQLLNTQNVSRDIALRTFVQNLIKKIVMSAASVGLGTVGAIVFSPYFALRGLSKTSRNMDAEREKRERDRYKKAGKEYPETVSDMLYQNTKEYALQEEVLMRKLGLTPQYFSQDLQEEYKIIEATIKRNYAGDELINVLSSVSLSEDNNIIVNGREIAILNGIDGLKEFMKYEKQYFIDHPEYVLRDYNIFSPAKLNGIAYMFLDASNPVVKEYLYPDKAYNHEQGLSNIQTSEGSINTDNTEIGIIDPKQGESVPVEKKSVLQAVQNDTSEFGLDRDVKRDMEYRKEVLSPEYNQPSDDQELNEPVQTPTSQDLYDLFGDIIH